MRSAGSPACLGRPIPGCLISGKTPKIASKTSLIRVARQTIAGLTIQESVPADDQFLTLVINIQ